MIFAAVVIFRLKFVFPSRKPQLFPYRSAKMYFPSKRDLKKADTKKPKQTEQKNQNIEVRTEIPKCLCHTFSFISCFMLGNSPRGLFSFCLMPQGHVRIQPRWHERTPVNRRSRASERHFINSQTGLFTFCVVTNGNESRPFFRLTGFTYTAVLQFLPPLHLVCFIVFHKRLHEVFGSGSCGVLAAGVGQGSFWGGGGDGRRRSNLLDLSCTSHEHDKLSCATQEKISYTCLA